MELSDAGLDRRTENGTQKPAVLITGAAGDIGSAVASLLANDYAVIVADHPNVATKLDERKDKLQADGASVFAVTFDVTNRDDVDRAFAECADNFMTPSLLFNNAGYQGAFTRIDRMQTADVERVMLINVVGVFNVIAAFSSRLIAQSTSGVIVNTASMAGVGGAPNMAGYSASKAAVIGLTKTAAKDLAPFGIRVNAVSPAFIGPGAMWDRQVELQAAAQSQYYATDPTEVAKQMIAMVPLRRYGSTGEVANVVRFLLSEASSYLTGVNIEISGGSA